MHINIGFYYKFQSWCMERAVKKNIGTIYLLNIIIIKILSVKLLKFILYFIMYTIIVKCQLPIF